MVSRHICSFLPSRCTDRKFLISLRPNSIRWITCACTFATFFCVWRWHSIIERRDITQRILWHSSCKVEAHRGESWCDHCSYVSAMRLHYKIKTICSPEFWTGPHDIKIMSYGIGRRLSCWKLRSETSVCSFTARIYGKWIRIANLGSRNPSAKI